ASDAQLVPGSSAAFREANQILVEENCPEPWQSFEDALPQLGKVLIKALKGQNYTLPTPIQAQAWPVALQGRDMVAVAKTGSGKTCGFLLPVRAKVVSIYGGVPKGDQVRELKKGCDVLIVAAPAADGKTTDDYQRALAEDPNTVMADAGPLWVGSSSTLTVPGAGEAQAQLANAKARAVMWIDPLTGAAFINVRYFRYGA
ncbi:unnamed protein product, partial [Polarella glacialis]